MRLIDKTSREIEYTVTLNREEMILLLMAAYGPYNLYGRTIASMNDLGKTASIHPFRDEIIKFSKSYETSNRLYLDLLEVLKDN